MKKSLLATVAAVALIAGTGIASAEGAKDQPKGGQAQMSQGADTKVGAEMKGKAQTTGSGAEMKAEGKADTKSDVKAPAKADMKADSKDKAASDTKSKPAATTGQASDQKSAPKSASDQKAGAGGAAKSSATETGNRPAANSQAQDSKADNKASGTNAAQGAQQGTQSGSASSAASQSNTNVNVNLTTEQKREIRTTVLKSGPKVSRSSINFNISVGTVVPRTVKFVTVPETLVRIHPQWRGYVYFIVDDEIIIVEPRTYKIVTILTV
jgi:hypothetical protein